tara:strand:- start:1330 stop:1449 length:120 start_codon:yes stop_codon:yes gene_type:complete
MRYLQTLIKPFFENDSLILFSVIIENSIKGYILYKNMGL